MGKVFFRKNVNEAYRWEEDGAARYKPLNKNFKDNFVGTAEIDPNTDQPVERHDLKSKSRMIGGAHFNRETHNKKNAGDWAFGLQSLNKLPHDMEMVVLDWKDNAEHIFQNSPAFFIYDYVDYVMKNMPVDLLNFNDWCKQNGIDIKDEINMQRAYKKADYIKNRK